jgi:hypothetical protein
MPVSVEALSRSLEAIRFPHSVEGNCLVLEAPVPLRTVPYITLTPSPIGPGISFWATCAEAIPQDRHVDALFFANSAIRETSLVRPYLSPRADFVTVAEGSFGEPLELQRLAYLANGFAFESCAIAAGLHHLLVNGQSVQDSARCVYWAGRSGEWSSIQQVEDTPPPMGAIGGIKFL